ncbi:hypothetical protein TNCV_4357511 [Trichonephila clavipes]|nr:hypothetical protein TNCV_4357511 [Trichonephila clavipes]
MLCVLAQVWNKQTLGFGDVYLDARMNLALYYFCIASLLLEYLLLHTDSLTTNSGCEKIRLCQGGSLCLTSPKGFTKFCDCNLKEYKNLNTRRFHELYRPKKQIQRDELTKETPHVYDNQTTISDQSQETILFLPDHPGGRSLTAVLNFFAPTQFKRFALNKTRDLFLPQPFPSESSKLLPGVKVFFQNTLTQPSHANIPYSLSPTAASDTTRHRQDYG